MKSNIYQLSKLGVKIARYEGFPFKKLAKCHTCFSPATIPTLNYLHSFEQ